MKLNNPFDSLDKTFDTKDKTKALQANLKETRKENNLPVPPANAEQDLEDDFQEARDILRRTADTVKKLSKACFTLLRTAISLEHMK